MKTTQNTVVARSPLSSELVTGFVKVENDEGRLRLRFSYGGKRHTIAVGLPDSQINRIVAQQKATQIELDIASGNFDSTLKKYKPPKASSKKPATATVPGLFQKFMDTQSKAKDLQVGSLCRYTATLRHLEAFFPKESPDGIDAKSAENFARYLKRQVADRTAKDYLILVQSCWNWAEQTVEHNPWSAVLNQVKPAPKQKVKPFTLAEVQAILTEFGTNRYYQHYADFVAFLFGTGCRFGEAAALRWRHIADDYSTVWIGESVSRGVCKTTKTGKDRTVTLTAKVAAMLAARKPKHADPNALVFPAPKGSYINDHTFRRRAWSRILDKLKIHYRKPYATRHTAISHALANGADPLAIAEQTGHDPQILFKHYASVIRKTAVMVEF
ncbi:MAG: tyrosine-type recombinase/integrase [Cyanobacteria bacterium J06626_18]